MKGTVGQGAENDPDDVFVVRHLMRVAGGGEVDQTKNDPATDGFFDLELNDEVHEYQEKNGLRVDGILTPGGETERNIDSRIVDDGRPIGQTTDFSLNHSVGEGAENVPEDVATVRRLLAASGRLPFDISSPPPPFIDGKTVDVLRDVQLEKGLPTDGSVSDGDATLVALQEEAEDKLDKRVNQKSVQVAALPALVLAILAGTRVAAHLAKTLGRSGGAIIVGEAGKKAAEEMRRERQERTEAAPPVLNIFPGGATEPPIPDGDREEFPEHRNDVQPERFPVLSSSGPWIQILPDQSDENLIPNIFENRDCRVAPDCRHCWRAFFEGTFAGRRKSFVVSWNDDPAGLSVASVEPPAVHIRRFFYRHPVPVPSW